MNQRSSRPTVPLRERQREAVTAALVDAAEAVIADKGLAGAAMADIARAAGVAVGTVYNYFADRDALVQAVLAARRAALVPRLRAAARAHVDLEPARALRAFVHDALALMEEHRRFVRLAFETQPPVGTRRDRTVLAELQAAIAGILGRDARAALAGRVVLAALRATMLDALEHDRPFTADADPLTDVLLAGVLGP